jgi:phosphoribosyl-AMP cyclohydrolase
MLTEPDAPEGQEIAVLDLNELKYDHNGLLPAVIQDSRTGAVLMVGYMDREALRRTLESGKAWFWSRSRRVYWLKGETSGNVLEVREVFADCDADTLLVKVIPRGAGVACHTGRYSCFFNLLGGGKPPA